MTASLHPPAGIPDGVPDLARFVGAVAAHINGGVLAQAADLDQAPVFVSRAPGRLDVMGGIADYSGALVLQWPIREATRVALLPWPERRLSITSVDRPRRSCCLELRNPYANASDPPTLMRQVLLRVDRDHEWPLLR